MRSVLAVAVALAAGCGSLPSGRDLGDPLDPGRDARVGLPVLSFLWKRVVHDRSWEHIPQEFASPAVHRRVDGDVVFVGSHGGEFLALSASDGRPIWRKRTGATSARPLVTGGRIFLGTDDGAILALDTSDGEIMWRYATKGAVQHPPVVLGDLVIFSNDTDRVIALDRETGRWKWQYDRETPEEYTVRGHAGVSTDGERVYCGFADGHVVALTPRTGDAVWVRSLAGAATQFVDVDTTPVVKGGVLYAASMSGGLYALDVTDGTERWRFEVEGVAELAVDDTRVYFGAADEGLYALDHAGHVLWRQGLERAGDPARPVLEGEYLFLSTAEDGLFIVDRASGQLVQRFDPGPGISSEPAIADDRLFALSNGGILYAMTLRQFE